MRGKMRRGSMRLSVYRESQNWKNYLREKNRYLDLECYTIINHLVTMHSFS